MTNHRRDKSSKPREHKEDLVKVRSVRNPQSEEIQQIFFGKDSEELTDKLIDELVSRGWEKKGLLEFQKQGYRYNRSRDSLLEGQSHFEGISEDDPRLARFR
jgi:hypothetical protein